MVKSKAKRHKLILKKKISSELYGIKGPMSTDFIANKTFVGLNNLAYSI